MLKLYIKNVRDLFSKIKIRKQLKKGIQEIAFIMIGILLALQVKNWNANRKDKIVEKDLLENMLLDLRLDSISFDNNLHNLNNIDSLHNQLYNIGVKGMQVTNLKNPNLIRRTLNFNPLTKSNEPHFAEKIKNKKIRQGIISYYLNLDKVERIEFQFLQVVTKTLRPYLGKRKAYNLATIFENDLTANGAVINELISKEKLIALSKDPEFQQILFESNLKLSDAINFIGFAIEENAKLTDIIHSELDGNY